MKAVVLELRGSKAAVLDDNGTFRIVKNEAYQVGQVIEVSSVTAISPIRSFVQKHVMPVAASFAILLLAGGTATAYAMPYSVVTMEKQASLKYTLNVFDRVISVSGEDAESSRISEALSGQLRGKKIEDAVTLTLDYLADDAGTPAEGPGAGEGFSGTTDEEVVIKVHSHLNREAKLEEKIGAAVDTWNAENPEHHELPEPPAGAEPQGPDHQGPEMAPEPAADGKKAEEGGTPDRPGIPEDASVGGSPAGPAGPAAGPENGERPDGDADDGTDDRPEMQGSREDSGNSGASGQPAPQEPSAAPQGGDSADLRQEGELSVPAESAASAETAAPADPGMNAGFPVPAAPADQADPAAESAAWPEPAASEESPVEIGPGVNLESGAVQDGTGAAGTETGISDGGMEENTPGEENPDHSAEENSPGEDRPDTGAGSGGSGHDDAGGNGAGGDGAGGGDDGHGGENSGGDGGRF